MTAADPTVNGARTRDLDVPRTTLSSSSSGRSSFLPGTGTGKFPWRLRWLGVPLLLALCLVSGWWSWGHMEDQLDERALVHLGCDDIDVDDLDLDWSYRSVTVTGDLPAGVTADQVERTIKDGSSNTACLEASDAINADTNPGVYNVSVLAAAGAVAAIPEPAATATPVVEPTVEPTAVPTAEPTEVPARDASIDASAAFDGETVILTGLVASEAQRQQIVDAANSRVGEDNVIDELELAEGEPTAASIERAAELATVIAAFDGDSVIEGSASVSDQALTYALRSPSDEARDALDLPGSGTVEVPEPAPVDDEPMEPASVEFTG